MCFNIFYQPITLFFLTETSIFETIIIPKNISISQGLVASASQQTKQNKKAHKAKGGEKSILFVYQRIYFQQIKLQPHQTKLRQNARIPIYYKVYGYCTQKQGGKTVSPSSVFPE